MIDHRARFRALLRELRRRRVYHVAGIYPALAWAGLGAADLLLSLLSLPDVLLNVLAAVAVAGYPVALALAWAYEVSTRGVRPEAGGPLRDFIGRSVLARLAVVGVLVVLSGALGWGSWAFVLRPPDAEGVEREESREAEAPLELDPARVAVLYFDDMSPGQELGYLADGLTEELIHELSQVEALEVVSRSGVKPFADHPVPLDSIVREIRAGSIVEGSVSRSGDHIRVTVQLVDGETGAHLDSDVLEYAESDLFALQDRIADEVSRSLRQRLGREIELRQVRSGTESVEAWTLLQQAGRLHEEYRALLRTDRDAAIRALLRADSLLALAEAADTSWAEPSLRRAAVVEMLALQRGPRTGQHDPALARRAIEHAERALRRDPGSAEALEVRGSLRSALARRAEGGERRAFREAAEADLRQAVEDQPDLANAWWSLSELYLEQARFAEAKLAAERALEADAFLQAPQTVIHTLYYAAVQLGPTDEALQWCERGLRDYPQSGNFLLCQLYVLASFPQVEPDVARAWELAERYVASAAEDNQEALRAQGVMQVAKVAARAGMPDSARAIIHRARGEDPPQWLAYDEAHARLLLGERDRALELLSSYLEVDPDTAFIAEDWWFEDLHDDERFRRMVGASPD